MRDFDVTVKTKDKEHKFIGSNCKITEKNIGARFGQDVKETILCETYKITEEK